MKEKQKNKAGISLIVLVITIIVLLILAGVVISTLSGENGILKQATEAKENTELATTKERISMVVMQAYMETNNNITDESLKKACDNEFGE